MITGGGLGLAARGGGSSEQQFSVLFVEPYSLAKLSANPDLTILVTEIGESSTPGLLKVECSSLDWITGLLACTTGLASLLMGTGQGTEDGSGGGGGILDSLGFTAGISFSTGRGGGGGGTVGWAGGLANVTGICSLKLLWVTLLAGGAVLGRGGGGWSLAGSISSSLPKLVLSTS